MPFDYAEYSQKCATTTAEELAREYNHYTRLISAPATSTTLSVLAIPFTAGLSTIGVLFAAPSLDNAHEKRKIVRQSLQRLGATHRTRLRDITSSVAISGTVGVVTLGLGTLVADAIMAAGVEEGVALCATPVKIISHVALDGAGTAAEHMHTSHTKREEAVQ